MDPITLANLVSVGAGIFSGIRARRKAKKAMRERKKLLDNLSVENDNNFYRDYYENVLDNDSAKAYLKKIDSRTRDKIEAINNSAIATGATHENVMAQKKAANDIESDAISNLVIQQEGKKERAKERWFANKANIANAGTQFYREKEMNYANAGNNMVGSLTQLASTYLDEGGNLFGKSGTVHNEAKLNTHGLSDITGKSHDFIDDITNKNKIVGAI